jgi:glycosyltransferase involved in cell wall biosynthesis
VSVLCFDLADNATGRAELLARLLMPRYDATVIGPRFGSVRWAPAQGGPVAYREVEGQRYPRFAGRVGRIIDLIDGDLIIASKPRPTSFGIGLLARARRRRPLLLDIDDWEVGFFYRAGLWGRAGRFVNFGNPNGLPWTWLMERLVRLADATTVASRFLERRFGGVLVPHVRDTEAWDPARYDRAAARAKLGVGDEPVVMFLGTPRGHKGVDDLVDAIEHLVGTTRGPARSAALVIVGADLDSAAARRWREKPFVRLIGTIPFDEVPRYLVGADVVAVPQRATSDTAGQVPAKLFDAMALARPVVSTAVSMIPEILDGVGGIVPPGDPRALAAAIGRLIERPDDAAALGRAARERCIARYSFTAARAALFPVVDRLLAEGRSELRIDRGRR